MAGQYVVEVGVSPSQIATMFGFEGWSQLYQHVSNAELRRLRSNSSRIFPGDKVAIPETPRQVFMFETGKRHKLILRRPRAKLNVVVNNANGEPLGDKRFDLVVPGIEKPVQGYTTTDGRVECDVPCSAREAQLIIWAKERDSGPRYVWHLVLAGLFAPDTEEGARQRLNNLGYFAGLTRAVEQSAVQGTTTSPLTMAIRAFQEDLGLEITGKLDPRTLAKLIEAHGGT